MLSYSPRQIVSGFAQRTLMPLVFCELALAYPPAKVSDPNQRVAAANGQFLLVEREAYRRLGGHASGGRQGAGRRGTGLSGQAPQGRTAVPLCRGCGGDAHVSHHRGDDRGLDQKPGAAVRQCSGDWPCGGRWIFFCCLGCRVLAIELWNARFAAHSLEWLAAGWVLLLLWVRNLFRFYWRVAKSNFPFVDCALVAAGIAAVCCAAVSKLVSAPDSEARKLEGQEYAG